jgi:hypothetical protein
MESSDARKGFKLVIEDLVIAELVQTSISGTEASISGSPCPFASPT